MRFFADIPIYFLPLIAGGCLLLALFFYQKQDWLSGEKRGLKYALIALRTALLFCIAALLFGIFFEKNEVKEDLPILAILKDNSSSMLAHKDSLEVKDIYQNIAQQIQDKAKGKYEIVEIDFPSESSGFNGTSSDLSTPLKNAFQSFANQNLGGVIMLSDGQYNRGVDPIYEAQNYANVPIYTLGLGDTTTKKDQYIRSVRANSTAFLDNDFPVEVVVSADDFLGASTKLSVYKGDQVVSSQQVNFKSNRATVRVNFQLAAKEVGVNRYRVVLDRLKNESTYQNNVQSFYVEVLEKKKKVLLLTAAPHPDIAAIKAVYEGINGVELESTLVKDFKNNLESYDYVVFHEPGHPAASVAFKAAQQSKTPCLYIVGIGSKPNAINQGTLGLRLITNGQTDQVEPYFESNYQGLILTDETRNEFRTWPALTTWFGEHQINSAAKIVMRQRIGPVKKKDPLFYIFNDGNKEIGVCLGTGLWRWRLAEYHSKESFDHFNEFIDGVGQVLMANKNKQEFEVVIPPRILAQDDFTGRAFLYNAAGQLAKNAKIQLRLKNEQGKVNVLEFSEMESMYSLNAGRLNPGIWSWTTTAKLDGKAYTKSGQSVVIESDLETMLVQANHDVLEQISTLTGGKFFSGKQRSALIDELAHAEGMNSLGREERIQKNIIEWWPLLLMIAFLAGAEWVIRRIFGGY